MLVEVGDTSPAKVYDSVCVFRQPAYQGGRLLRTFFNSKGIARADRVGRGGRGNLAVADFSSTFFSGTI